MRQCPTCKATYEDDVLVCPDDEQATVEAPKRRISVSVPAIPPPALPLDAPETLRLSEDLSQETIRFDQTEAQAKGFAESFGKYHLYEFLSEESLLHIGYQNAKPESAQEVDSIWNELDELFAKHPASWLIMCFDDLVLSQEAAEALIARAASLTEKTRGIVRYATGHARLAKQLAALREETQKQLRIQLVPSKQQAFQEVKKLIDKSKPAS